jgi:hypothetical protein
MEFHYAYRLLDGNADVGRRVNSGDGSPKRIGDRSDTAVPVMAQADIGFCFFGDCLRKGVALCPLPRAGRHGAE